MLERIIADYGFYMGWSFGMTAFLMAAEWIYTGLAHNTELKRLKRMSRLNGTLK